MQETKLGKSVEFELNNYTVYHNNRNSSGGGLITAVDPSLNPMEITPGSSTAEILVVQIEIGNKKVRIINGYGPQNDDTMVKNKNFGLVSIMRLSVLSAKDV